MKLTNTSRIVILLLIVVTVSCNSPINSEFSLSNGCSNFGQCSQKCIGSSECSCIPGFQLDTNEKSCNLVDSNWKLFFGNYRKFGYIQSYSNGSKETVMLYSKDDDVVYPEHLAMKDVTFDARSNRIFWSDAHLRGIYSHVGMVSVAENPTIFVRSRERDRIHGFASALAFDWIAGNLYYVDSMLGEIAACRNDSINFCAVIVKVTDTEGRPHDIALHPNLGIMFWTDGDNIPGIMRAGMDGTFITRIVSSNLKQPLGIAVDQGNSRVYWTDEARSVIESAKFDGGDRRIILQSKERRPFAFDILGDMMAWSVVRKDAIDFTSNKFSVVDRTTLKNESMGETIYALGFLHPVKQPISRWNPCFINSHCAHLCVLTPVSNSKGYGCFCPDGMSPHTLIPEACAGFLYCTAINCSPVPKNSDRLKASNKMIVAFHNIIAVTTSDLSEQEMIFERMHFPEVNEIRAIAYNQVNDTVIFANKTKILEYHFGSGNLAVLVEDGLEAVSGMDIDSATGNLYWCDNAKGTVEVMSLVTKGRNILMTDVQSVTDIVIAPGLGSFFLTEASGIHKYTLGGSRLYFTKPNPDVPTSLVYHESGYILWSGNHGNSIESISLQETTKEPEVIVAAANPTVDKNVSTIAPGSIVIYEGTIFWVDFHSLDLKRIQVNLESHKSSSLSSTKFLREDEQDRNAVSGYRNFKMILAKSKVQEQPNTIMKSSCSLEKCSHGCLSSGECGCPQGLTLQADGKTCASGEALQSAADNSSHFGIYFFWLMGLSIICVLLVIMVGFVLIKSKRNSTNNMRPIMFENRNYEYHDSL